MPPKKPVSEQGRERIIVSGGELSTAAEQQVLDLLRSLGRTATVYTPDEFQNFLHQTNQKSSGRVSNGEDQKLSPPPHISDLTSPGDWFVREHIDEFVAGLESKVGGNTAGTVFNSLIDKRPAGQIKDWNPDLHPEYSYLDIKPRNEVGILPFRTSGGDYSFQRCQSAIQLGSLLKFGQHAKLSGLRGEFIASLCASLASQIQDPVKHD